MAANVSTCNHGFLFVCMGMRGGGGGDLFFSYFHDSTHCHGILKIVLGIRFRAYLPRSPASARSAGPGNSLFT